MNGTDQNTAGTTCRQCGTSADAGGIFCAECGVALRPPSSLISSSDTQRQPFQDTTAVPAAVTGWLLLFCLILTFVYPATSLYHIFSHTLPTAIAAHALNRILLLSVYSLVFSALAVFSFVAGVRLWLVKPNAVEFAKRYLLTNLTANITYFVFWIVAIRPTKQVAFAEMGWDHVVGPVAFVALWYSYLVHSKRVRNTYSVP